jgi:ribulose bisphosphate carboxylase small subunit
VTNIQVDAEIAGSSAVDIVERALFYLNEKGRLRLPTPALISHYLINEPQRGAADSPYVPLGRLDALDDPRLVRIGHYEDGVTGRHDASKLLKPFLESFLTRGRSPRVAVVLHDVDSQNKLCQSVLEMIRGGITGVSATVSVFHDGGESLDDAFASRLPFPVVRIDAPRGEWDRVLRQRIVGGQFDYVVLFESSGMYRGEDVVSLVMPLTFGRLGAVWGSRRLSVRDMEESYRLRYRHNWWLGTASAAGSYALSLAYLLLYGRYVSDTLSGARAMRAAYFLDSGVSLQDKQTNQELLSALMRQRAEIQEVYVRFVALSPERVKRTTILDGLASIATIVRRRFSGRRAAAAGAPGAS